MGGRGELGRHDPHTLSERLTWIRQLAENQHQLRDTQADCPHDQGTSEFVHRFANGADHLYRGCTTCHAPMDPGHWLTQNGDAIPGLGVGLDDRHRNPPCARCGAFGTELHHWAPRSLFGPDEADLWPTAWLCPPCHRLWHNTIRNGT